MKQQDGIPIGHVKEQHVWWRRIALARRVVSKSFRQLRIPLIEPMLELLQSNPLCGMRRRVNRIYLLDDAAYDEAWGWLSPCEE